MKPKALIGFDISEQSFLADYWAEYDFYEEEWKNYLKLLDLKEGEFHPRFYNFDDIGLKNKFSSDSDKLVVISAVSFDKERLWDEMYWHKTINFLLNQGYFVVFTGLESQKDYLTNLTKNLHNEKYKVLTNLNIPELASLIRSSRFVLCIDSFITHLAIALEKPVICLLNPDIYYLKGFSLRKAFVDTKSMVPLIESVTILPTIDTDDKKMIQHCEKLIFNKKMLR